MTCAMVHYQGPVGSCDLVASGPIRRVASQTFAIHVKVNILKLQTSYDCTDQLQYGSICRLSASACAVEPVMCNVWRLGFALTLQRDWSVRRHQKYVQVPAIHSIADQWRQRKFRPIHELLSETETRARNERRQYTSVSLRQV